MYLPLELRNMVPADRHVGTVPLRRDDLRGLRKPQKASKENPRLSK